MLQRGSKGRRSASRIYAREMVEVMIKAVDFRFGQLKPPDTRQENAR
jgi:hypothetical protein